MMARGRRDLVIINIINQYFYYFSFIMMAWGRRDLMRATRLPPSWDLSRSKLVPSGLLRISLPACWAWILLRGRMAQDVFQSYWLPDIVFAFMGVQNSRQSLSLFHKSIVPNSPVLLSKSMAKMFHFTPSVLRPKWFLVGCVRQVHWQACCRDGKSVATFRSMDDVNVKHQQRCNVNLALGSNSLDNIA